jgi:hypothetical protein
MVDAWKRTSHKCCFPQKYSFPGQAEAIQVYVAICGDDIPTLNILLLSIIPIDHSIIKNKIAQAAQQKAFFMLGPSRKSIPCPILLPSYKL